jgi:diguanylate cyclase (GGDEF)-like protein
LRTVDAHVVRIEKRFVMTVIESMNTPMSSRGSTLLQRAFVRRVLFYSQLACVAVVVGYVVALFTVFHALPYSGTATDRWLRHIALALPILPIFIRARTTTTLRGAWYLIGVGVVLFNVASLLDLARVTSLSRFATPTVHDSLLLLSFLAVAVSVVMVMQQSFGPRANSVRLDGIIAGLSLAAWASMCWFRGDIEVTGHPLIAELNLFNPILVLVLLVLLMAGLVPRRFRLNLSTTYLTVGLGTIAIGDFIQLNRVAALSRVSEALVSASRPLGLCCIALAAWPAIDRRSETRDAVGSARGLNIIPVIFGTVSIAILTVAVDRPTPESTRFMALGSLLFVILRMVMSQGEARQLGRSSFVEARTDHVTGLSNRRAFLEDGEALLANLRPPDRLAIALIDLDGFKEVNDSIGHAYGDELLKVIGRRFLQLAGDQGSMARLGGDEFAYTFVVDPNVDPLAVATGLSRTLASPVSLDGTKVRVSASIGVAVWPHHGATHSELLRSADVAMYEAKRNHSEVCLYRDEIDVNSRERLSMINELRTAIDRRRLTLHFQPTRDLRSGKIHGVEALVRWQHPTLGLLQPDSFVPLAERVGLIGPLTRAVLDLAITELARLDRRGEELTMSVNISQWDLVDPQLSESITRLLEWYKTPADRITLEVTESSLSQNPEVAKQSLQRLRSLGVKVSIDDFGVGYSSMSQLLELPVDELKIDKSFVLALESDPRAISLIRSIVEMAKALELVVVAEGIESASSFDALRIVGADIIQGDHVARPLTSEQLDEFLDREASADAANPQISDESRPRRIRHTGHLRVV